MKTHEFKCPVLIVDDDKDLCQILSLTLPKECNVQVEHSLKSADTALDNMEPDIIILDNNLPDGYGIPHIKDILHHYPKANIIVMTSDTTTGLADTAIQEGAARFISKPFRAAALNEIIYSLCPDLARA